MATTTAQLKPAGKGAEPTEKKKGKSKKKLIIILVPLILLVGGVGYLKFGKKHPPAPPKPGAVVALDAITLNLTDGHYLKLGLALQATATAKGTIDGSQALDIAIDEFSNHSVAELTSDAARTRYKADLRKKVSKAYAGKVMDVFFTEFVMQ